jgi:hypothetical protein
MDQCSVPDSAEDARTDTEARREALKRFVRYAAVAPTAMLLLDPRSGHAYGHGHENDG